MKVSAVANAIQGLVKYHGLKDKKRRIPFHDSVSVCAEGLTTTATVEFNPKLTEDAITINGRYPSQTEASRILAVTNPLRAKARSKEHFRLATLNSLPKGKGLGFSAAAFASIAMATSRALDLKIDMEHLSEFARLGAGSASRSLVGGFSIWYANRNGRSFARLLASDRDLPMGIVVVPVHSTVKTDMAHEESVTSPFFKARLTEVRRTLRLMLEAIRKRDIEKVGRISEAESLSLHAATMTGESGLLLMAPETLKVIGLVKSMREDDGIPVWYSLDTGPSIYVNTELEYVEKVAETIERTEKLQVIRSGVGGPARVATEHLF